MNTVICTKCGEKIQIDQALKGEIEAKVTAAAELRHAADLEKVEADAAARAKKLVDATAEELRKTAADDLEIAKKKLEAELVSSRKKVTAEQEILIKSLKDDADSEKQQAIMLREQMAEIMQTLRKEKDARANAELEAQKKLAASEGQIRAAATKEADERQRLNLAARDKTIADLQSSLDDAQRKAAQGSQQLQGEIMELDFESALQNAFRDDDIAPVAKGVKGGDIMQVVCSPRGVECGSLLWEIKRTKNWTDAWIPKLKTDARAARANISIIVTEVMPKQIDQDMGLLNGVWVCKPSVAIILGTLLRKGLLDAGYQRALAENRGEKADQLYNFITSHEFIQQIESMVETYQEMNQQVTKERVAYEKMWAQREKQAQKLLMSTANVVGSMQGHIGQAAMPKIKGLELDSGLDD